MHDLRNLQPPTYLRLRRYSFLSPSTCFSGLRHYTHRRHPKHQLRFSTESRFISSYQYFVTTQDRTIHIIQSQSHKMFVVFETDMDVFRTDDFLFYPLSNSTISFCIYFYIDYLTTVTVSQITQCRKQGNSQKWIVKMQN
jgi:hypothetical protein